jgi:hypothetical protein
MLLTGTGRWPGSKSGRSGATRHVRFEIRDMHGPLSATIKVHCVAIQNTFKRWKNAWGYKIECEAGIRCTDVIMEMYMARSVPGLVACSDLRIIWHDDAT